MKTHEKRLAVVGGHLKSAGVSSLFGGSVAIITGAGRGIGREAAILFAQNGARLVLNDLDRYGRRRGEKGGTPCSRFPLNLEALSRRFRANISETNFYDARC